MPPDKAFYSGKKCIMPKGNNVLTTGDVARICNVASRTVMQWFDNGLLGGYRIPGSRDRRIPIAELARFMRKYGIPIPAATGEDKKLLKSLAESFSD